MVPPQRPGRLQLVVSEGAIVQLAGPRAFARGAAYHHDGRVELGTVSADRVQAVVRGSRPYEVHLSAAAAELAWSCSCPVGSDGEFCKHCVAVALSVGNADTDAPRQPRRARKADRDKVDLRSYLETLSDDTLVDLVLDRATDDWRLRERLTAHAAAAAGSGIDEATWRRRVDAAFAPDGDFVPYREAAGWAADVDDVMSALEEQLDAGHAAAVITLLEHAHRKADAAVQYIDDSDGWLTNISDRIGELHHRACAQSSPDPVQLARRLVDLELTSELDAFHRAAARYADVLGGAGIGEYRRLVEPKWRKLGPDSDRWSGQSFRLREGMIGVALATGDPDELIRVKQRDLRTPDDYREIAESLAVASRLDDAIDWARRGLDAFTDRPWQNRPLRELLAALLRSQGDSAGAVELFWQAFTAHPSLDRYRRLLTEADTPTAQADWRQRALAAMRQRVDEGRPDDRSRRSIMDATPASVLIEMLLYEDDIETAWVIAIEHGCEQRLWLTLARARETTHPLDSIPIYEREALAQIDTKTNRGYRNAVDHLERIRRLATSAGEPERFDQLLTEIRVKHKPKRNLMALLDKKHW
jgi:uncharacterized Zn finger protein